MKIIRTWQGNEVAEALRQCRMLRQRPDEDAHHGRLVAEFVTDERVAKMLAEYLASSGYDLLRVVGDPATSRTMLFDLGWALHSSCGGNDSEDCSVCWALDLLCTTPMLTTFVDARGGDICRKLLVARSAA